MRLRLVLATPRRKYSNTHQTVRRICSEARTTQSDNYASKTLRSGCVRSTFRAWRFVVKHSIRICNRSAFGCK
eukprot:15363079-Alexandrium_andersonii.AAC.1